MSATHCALYSYEQVGKGGIEMREEAKETVGSCNK